MEKNYFLYYTIGIFEKKQQAVGYISKSLHSSANYRTMPITIASRERSFSNLKLIKTYLRTTMNKDSLWALSLISIKSEIASNINLTEVIKKYAEAKARRVPINH